MKNLTLLPLLLTLGCSQPPDPVPQAEWFVFVSPELSQALHDRFADELPLFIEQCATPGDQVHVAESRGIVSFSIRVPEDLKTASRDVLREIKEATEYFTSATHLEGLDSCRLATDLIERRLLDLRTTDFEPRILLLGSERPHRYLDFGCECENRPHSLLKEFYAARFHPEFTVPTKSKLEFEAEYGSF